MLRQPVITTAAVLALVFSACSLVFSACSDSADLVEEVRPVSIERIAADAIGMAAIYSSERPALPDNPLAD